MDQYIELKNYASRVKVYYSVLEEIAEEKINKRRRKLKCDE